MSQWPYNNDMHEAATVTSYRALLYKPACTSGVLFSVTEFILTLGQRFHALLKVCCDRDDVVPLIQYNKSWNY